MGKARIHDVAFVGGGPAGYVGAIRAAQLGMDAACIDANRDLGGTCLRVGCIPSKALLESSELFDRARRELGDHGVRVGEVALDLAAMMERKQKVVSTLTRGVASLLRKAKVERVHGHARFERPGRLVVADPDGRETPLRARHVVIATGSRSAELRGVPLDGDRIGTSTEALAYEEVPRRLVVIGAGYVGLELGSVWARLGAQVTVLEAADRILPGTDLELAKAAQESLAKQGLGFRLGARVSAARTTKAGCVVEIEDQDPIECDRVLVAVGRRPNTDGLGLDAIGLATDDAGSIPVRDPYATEVEGVFAVGDVIGGPMLAHKASEEAVACVERIAGEPGALDYDTIPSVVYTRPEVASVGRTEEQLRERGTDFRKGAFPFRGNGRARCLGEVEGFVKVLADRRTDRLLGVHILGPRAGDLIAEAAAAIAFGATAEDLALTCHAHPTLPEALREAALASLGRAIHL